MQGIKSKQIIKILERGRRKLPRDNLTHYGKDWVAISASDLVWESCHLFVPDQKRA